MKIKIIRGLAIFFIFQVGLTHLFSADHAYEESWIEGYLFVANFLGALIAAYGIYRRKNWGWILGFMVAGGAMFFYTWSRTTGLPGLPAEEWIDPWGTTAFVVEGLFCLTALLCILSRRQLDESNLQTRSNWSYVFPVIGAISLVLINLGVFHLDNLYPELAHEHVFFLWQVKLQPEVTNQTLEEEYGLQVIQAVTTSWDSIVDVRLRVVDREKAEAMIEEGHFALLVGDTIIPSPHISRHMLVNKTIIIMFPNRQKIVSSGTPVSFVFENLKVEPVAVK
jgi:hypothetical protein